MHSGVDRTVFLQISDTPSASTLSQLTMRWKHMKTPQHLIGAPGVPCRTSCWLWVRSRKPFQPLQLLQLFLLPARPRAKHLTRLTGCQKICFSFIKQFTFWGHLETCTVQMYSVVSTKGRPPVARTKQLQLWKILENIWEHYENIMSFLFHPTSAWKLSVPLHKRHGVVRESTKLNPNPIQHCVCVCVMYLSSTLDNRIQVQVILSPVQWSKHRKEVSSLSTARPSTLYSQIKSDSEDFS